MLGLNESAVSFNDIVKRKLSDTDIRPNNVGPYLQKNNIEGEGVIGLCEEDGASKSFCIEKVFGQLPKDRTTSIGTKGTELIGCTVLVVVSARAAYMV